KKWSAHCAGVCNTLDVPCECITVNAQAAPGESPEAAARQARYDALSKFVQSNDCLLTAHHQDDQAETLLLQLLRGSGPKGLAAMPLWTDFAQGYLARPLLSFSREQIVTYARQQQLVWIDDVSNKDTAFDRNYLRLNILPLLKKRWPSLAKTVSRTAQLCAEASTILDETAADDLQHILGERADKVCIAKLTQLTQARQHNVVRHWLDSLDLRYPSQAILSQLWRSVIPAAEQAQPVLTWGSGEIRRYREFLYAQAPVADFNSTQVFACQPNQIIHIPLVGSLSLQSVKGQGLAIEKIKGELLSVRFRQGGERCRVFKRHGEHSVKKLFQELGVLPWMRDRIPLIYIGERLAAVGNYFICEDFAATPQQQGLVVSCDYDQSPLY
ncbi:tRNA lysidine(34) synthetase TilS, partial [Kaarinaea lacus]